MAKSKKKKAYFGLGRIVSIILAIIPFTNILFGIIERAIRGNILGLILNFFLAPIFYIIDLITIIIKGDLTVLA